MDNRLEKTSDELLKGVGDVRREAAKLGLPPEVLALLEKALGKLEKVVMTLWMRYGQDCPDFGKKPVVEAGPPYSDLEEIGDDVSRYTANTVPAVLAPEDALIEEEIAITEEEDSSGEGKGRCAGF